LVCRIPYNWAEKDGLEKFNQVWKTFGTFNTQMLEVYRAVGKKGQKGGNGGKGGVGGLPGESGTVKLQGFTAGIYSGKGKHG
jgi:hypothetical protein